MSGSVLFRDVTKVYRRGRERVNLRRSVPGRLGEAVRGESHIALDEVSFSVGAGESLGIIGHNGAGKSTVLKLIAGIVTPTSGSVERRGRVAALIELGAGFHPDMTGRENVRFAAAVLGMSRAHLRERLDQIYEFAEIDRYLDTPIKRYSSGMMARLGFAVAAHLDAEILVLDEVLSVGDAKFQRRCHERMRQLRSEGRTTLYVTHALWTLPMVCDRAILLGGGRVVAEGQPSDVLRAYRASASGSDQTDAGHPTDIQLTANAENIGPDQHVTIRGVIRAQTAHPQGALHVAVLGMTGELLAGLFSPDRLFESGEAEAEFVIRLDVRPLRPGDYRLTLSFQPDRAVPVVAAYLQLPLAIDGPFDEALGTVRLQARWAAG